MVQILFLTRPLKKSIKLILYAAFLALLLVFGEHLSRNSLLPALAPRVDGTVRDFSAWKITNATLSPENAREGLKSAVNQSILQVEVQNRLAISVLPPNLDITLTDAEEPEIKSVQWTPQEWLPKAWQESHPDFLKKGIPSGDHLQIELPISLPPNAAGYRVRVLYP